MRNLGLIISFWLSAISIPTNSVALGLGGIEVNSFLNQPLKAEIEVISARPGEIDDLLVSLASRDAFARAGLSRPQNLSDIRFTVQKSEEGDSAVILVTSKGAIKEPFLNFLVEADWSKGRLLREFTILLDPPFFAESAAQTTTQSVEPEAVQPTETVSSDSASEVPAPIVESEATDSTATTEQQTITEPIAFSEDDQVDEDVTSQAQSSGMVSQGDVRVDKGDTLWSIASALNDGTHSMSQIMLAIQRANPDAFGDDNINNLKVGSVLRMPDFEDIGSIDQQQAYAQVLEQNGLWEDYVARVTGQTSVSTAGQVDSAESTDDAESSGELNLVTPGDGSSDAAGLQSEGDDANELRLQLTLAEEELDASRVQNRELESRIAELEAQLSKFEELQKMVEIEDDSLAQLQENQAQEQIAADDSVNESISEAQKAADEEALLEELLSEEAQAQTDEAVETESDGDAMVEAGDGMAEDDTLQEPVESEADTEVTEEPDAQIDETASGTEETETLPPPPVIVTEAQVEPSFLDGLLPTGMLDMLPDMSGLALDPLMLGGVGGILALLIGLFIYRRKKSADDDTVVNDPIFAVDGDEDEEELTPIHLAEGVFEGLEEDDSVSTSITEEAVQTASMTLDEDDDQEDEFARTAVVSAEDMPTPDDSSPAAEEQDDVLNEADVYLAYNLYDNAEELLTSSLESNPERADYRAKLLDTYFATKNADAFISQAETLKSMGNPAERYWDRVMVMGYELAPDNELFAAAKDSGISAADLEFSKPAEADFDLGAEEDVTGFSTTDFDLGEGDTATFEATDFSSDDLGPDSETLEFDTLSEQEEDEIQLDETSDELPDLAGGDENTAELDDLDFSLDDSGDDNVELDIEDNTDIRENLDDLDFGLPDDLDIGGDDIDLGTEATAIMEAGTAVIDTDRFEAGLEDDDDGNLEPTSVINTNGLDADDITGFGMEDTAMSDSIADTTDDIMLDLGNVDDIDDSLSMDVDMSTDAARTDTFAPGDFDDPEEIEALETDISSAGLDDIEDLMLPDDVDEVSTKLDLARAFIDMGDAEGARGSLEEVLQEGNEEQKAEAKTLMEQL